MCSDVGESQSTRAEMSRTDARHTVPGTQNREKLMGYCLGEGGVRLSM